MEKNEGKQVEAIKIQNIHNFEQNSVEQVPSE